MAPGPGMARPPPLTQGCARNSELSRSRRRNFEPGQHPIQTINSAKERTGLSIPTVTAVMKSLEGAGIVRELTGKQRYRVFGYDRYLEILNEGTTATSLP